MTTPITIHLTDEQADRARHSTDALVAYEILALVREALPEPPRPFQPGDLVDRIGKPWREGTVLAVDGHLAWIKWYFGGRTTEHLCDIRHHQDGVA
jgi:hypothetical protein